MVAGMRAMRVLLLSMPFTLPLALAGALSGCSAVPESACRLDKVAELPVKMILNVPVVTVEINGHPAQMLIDTGSDATLLRRSAAPALGVVPGAATTALHGPSGEEAAGVARIGSLALGPERLTNVKALVADAPAPPLDGLLGIDVLVDYELDLDIPNHRVAFYRARSCPTALPDFPGRIIRLPTMQQPGSGHIYVSMAVDGQPLRGLLDSGASTSTLSLQSAEDTGLSRRRFAQLPHGQASTVNQGGLAIRQDRFRSLQVGQDTMANPSLTIADIPPFAGDVLVGEDYIGTRRMWFSFRLGRVFVPGQ